MYKCMERTLKRLIYKVPCIIEKIDSKERARVVCTHIGYQEKGLLCCELCLVLAHVNIENLPLVCVHVGT